MSLVIPKYIGLYIHLPWCIKKCPYCDFNSHQLRKELDEKSYINALLNDLSLEINRLDQQRVISSIFIGGGTPSLFTAQSIDMLLSTIQSTCELAENAEITLEANPGAADESRFRGYRQVGVNRLSIGIQSFNNQQLQSLGRVHDNSAAIRAVEIATSAGFDNYNLDLMYCLPAQTVTQAQTDIEQAIALSPTHISAYNLTIEPNTLFAHQPPVLPDENVSWEIQQMYWSVLEAVGYERYEISAYSKPGFKCRHNLNYWRFGDYLGIGAGAHGKVTTAKGIFRTLKPKHPDQYMRDFRDSFSDQQAYIKPVKAYDLPVEYMMNKLRLNETFSLEDFQSTTGLDHWVIRNSINTAIDLQLLESNQDKFVVSEKGNLFLDDLLQLFMADNANLDFSVDRCEVNLSI